MDQQLKLAEEEAQEYQAYLQKLDQETEDDNQVGNLFTEAVQQDSQLEPFYLRRSRQV